MKFLILHRYNVDTKICTHNVTLPSCAYNRIGDRSLQHYINKAKGEWEAGLCEARRTPPTPSGMRVEKEDKSLCSCSGESSC